MIVYKVVLKVRGMMLSTSVWPNESPCVRYVIGQICKPSIGYILAYTTYEQAKSMHLEGAVILECETPAIKKIDILCTHGVAKRYIQFWNGELDARWEVSAPVGTVGLKLCTPIKILAKRTGGKWIEFTRRY